MAAAGNIVSILQSLQSINNDERGAAELQLKQIEEQHRQSYWHALAKVISSSDTPPSVRQQAGLALKNALNPTVADAQRTVVAEWSSAALEVKQQIKRLLLDSLSSEVSEARHAAALDIAKVAALEMPAKGWPELIPSLRSNMERQPNSGLRQSTLECLGYICEEAVNLDDEDPLGQDNVNSVLTAIVQGIGKSEPDANVRLAATLALQNALEFAETNFQAQGERDFLMQVVCEGTMGPTARVREASFECLAGIAALHYSKLGPYMAEIFKLTQRAIREDEEPVAKQAIEFWCTICEEELEIEEVGDEADSGVVNHRFVQQALSPLVPALLAQLTKQEEGQDKDDGLWNLSMAAGTCLGLVATVVGDHIIILVMPYVQENIARNQTPEDWRCREAATFAFGSILEGPSLDQLAKLSSSGFEFLVNAMKDSNSQVRHTTAWTIGRIFEFVHGSEAELAIINSTTLPPIKEMLLQRINDEPHIAEKICYAIGQLAAGFKDSTASSVISPCFQEFVHALLNTAQRAGQEGEAQLQLQAFEAINEMVRYASQDTLPVVQQLVLVILQRLAQTVQPAATQAVSQERLSDLQGLLCGVLQVIVQKLSESDASKASVLTFSDQCMEILLQIFRAQNQTVHEEAMLAVGALTYACGPSFVKYLSHLHPVIQRGLRNTAEGQVCSVTVGVLGDICRAVESQVAPYCNAIMQILLENLADQAVSRDLKPQILSAFGDVALALGDQFEPYLIHVTGMLYNAQQLSINQQQLNDEPAYEYNNILRLGIFEAYSGIFNGLSPQKCQQFLQSSAKAILEFVSAMSLDKASLDDSVSRAGVALLGDVASAMPSTGVLFANSPPAQQFVDDCQHSLDPSVAQSAAWAAQAIKTALTAPAHSS